MGVMGVGIFWISASPPSRYFSLLRLIISSRVEPRSPLLFQVPIAYFALSIRMITSSAFWYMLISGSLIVNTRPFLLKTRSSPVN